MAKGIIGALRVNLGLDSAQFQAGIANVSKSMKKMEKDFQGFGKRLGSLSKTFVSGLAVAAAGTAASLLSVNAALGKAKAAMQEFSQLADQSKRLGLTAEALQELRFAAEQAGVAAGNFDTAFRRFTRRAAEAARGTGSAKNAFKELGVSLTDSQGNMRTMEDLFGAVADAMSNVQDHSNKLRLAFQLFDTDGAALLPMLDQGSKGLQEWAKQARELGIVIDNELIDRAADLQTQFETATKVIDTHFKIALVNLAPVLAGIAKTASVMADDIRRLVDSMLSLENQSTRALQTQMASLGLERIKIEGRLLELQREQAKLTEHAIKLGFGERTAGMNKELVDLEARLKAIADEEKAILEILAGRETKTPPKLPPPPPGNTRNAAAEAALREAEAVMALIDSLAHELSIIHESDLAKAQANALRQAGSAATASQRQQIMDLVQAIHEETEALRKNEEAQKAREQSIEAMFKMGEDALVSMIDNTLSAEEALKRFVIQLAKAVAQAALLGTGPLAGIFGGGLFKADGGAIKAASGGLIRGPGGPRSDVIPAMLSNGEFVVNAKAARQWRGLLERINAGMRFPGFNRGGLAYPLSESGPELVAHRCTRYIVPNVGGGM